MKHIQILEPIQLINPATGEAAKELVDPVHQIYKTQDPISMARFVVTNLLNDPVWNDNWRAMSAATRIKRAFDTATKWVSLEDDDFDKLKAVIEDPRVKGWGLNPPMYVQQMAPFCVAVLAASSTRPDESST